MKRKGDKAAYLRQKEVLDAIRSIRATEHRTPTYDEIGQSLGLSKASVCRYVANLRGGGFLGNEFDMDMLATQEELSDSLGVIRIPLLGRIVCGQPEYAVQEFESEVNFPIEFLDNEKGTYFALRTHGESMIELGIADGDIAIIREDLEPKNGDIVVALVNNEDATLKRLHRHADGIHVTLGVANPFYKDIELDLTEDTLNIQGVLVKLIKNF